MQRSIRVLKLERFEYVQTEAGYLHPGETRQTLELTYVDRGRLHTAADGKEQVLSQGDMMIYGPGQWHMQYAEVNDAPCLVRLSMVVEGSGISTLANRKGPMPQKAVMLLRQMLQERERQDAYSQDLLLTLSELLLLILLRDMDKAGKAIRTSHAVHSENEIIRRAQQFVSHHMRDKLTVPMVAQNADVSPSYLTALFHKHLNLSPGEYIRRVKLQESKRLIREGKMNFTEIAAVLNYSTVHHFSRQFKEKFGITPSEYSKSVR